MRVVLHDRDDALALLARLRTAGFAATLERERFAGEDDEEDHAWAVLSDAPEALAELLADEFDGWVEAPPEPVTVAPRSAPLDLPAGPRRHHRTPPRRERPGDRPRVVGMDQRLLLVHAHPDDETINNGATMAAYAARGTGVTLVTCTLGEEGEVLVPDLAHLASDRDDDLGPHRSTEIAAALAELGVTDHRYLGGQGRYRDTGMAWHEDGHAIAGEVVKDATFWRADLLEAADHLVDIIREVRPQVLVTYDQFGGYGHPDHIQAHRVAMYAASLAGVASYRPGQAEPWEIAKIYWVGMSESRMRASLRRLRDAGDTTTFEGMDPDGPLPPFVTPDRLLSAVVDGSDFVEAKLRAMRSYPTQIDVNGPFFALSNNVGNEVWAQESYRLVKGTPGPTDDSGLESDLFAGL